MTREPSFPPFATICGRWRYQKPKVRLNSDDVDIRTRGAKGWVPRKRLFAHSPFRKPDKNLLYPDKYISDEKFPAPGDGYEPLDGLTTTLSAPF